MRLLLLLMACVTLPGCAALDRDEVSSAQVVERHYVDGTIKQQTVQEYRSENDAMAEALQMEDQSNISAEAKKNRPPAPPDPAKVTFTTTPVSYDDLRVGKLYRLTGRTPLMPYREGRSVEDLARVRYLKSGDVIKVLKKDESGNLPWYRVIASNGSGHRIGTGWINSSILLRYEALELIGE